MILLINTSTEICNLTLIDGKRTISKKWKAERELAKGLHKFVRDNMDELGKGWDDIEAIGIFKGPGSFTGLRIGIAVMNTIADGFDIPIVGTSGRNWKTTARKRILAGENDQVVLPEYGREANITKPRK